MWTVALSQKAWTLQVDFLLRMREVAISERARFHPVGLPGSL